MTGTRAPEPLDPLAAVDSWDRLVSAALVGTAKRPVPDTPDLPATPEGGDAETLLGRAALIAVRRTAGYVPATGLTPVPPDTEDERPEVGPAATDRLERLLEDRHELLPEWLELATAGGRRAAHSSVPSLLDQGARDSQLRPALAAAIGTRGHWMARYRSTWSYMLAEPTPGDRFSEQDWERGEPGERRRALAALRATDPDRARELLVAAWPGLARAELRRRLLEALANGLGPADEDFLDGALDDRSANVRGIALSLLTRLPDSAHAERLRGYVRASASLESQGILRLDEAGTDAAAVRRDLALAGPKDEDENGHQRYERVWALITHTPLDVWPALLGTDPATVFAAAEKGRGRDNRLFGAFVNAIAVQRNAEWARAVLGTFSDRIASSTATVQSLQLAKLLEILPVEESCGYVLDALPDSAPLIRWAELTHAARGPWTPELSARVAGRLRARDRRRHDYRGYRELCEAAATHMSPEHLTELREDPPFDDASTEAYLRLRDTLRFRLDMHREL